MFRSVRRRGRRERGQTLAEFALIAPLLVILIFGFVDAARLYHAWVTIEGAAREGARYGVTGREDCATPSPTRLTCIQYNASQRAKELANASTDLTVSVRSWDYPTYTDPATEGDPGEQCDALEVQVDYDFTPAVVSTIFGSIHLVGRERLVNEPFGTCN
jgi:Flp pilus assembly protein TadG